MYPLIHSLTPDSTAHTCELALVVPALPLCDNAINERIQAPVNTLDDALQTIRALRHIFELRHVDQTGVDKAAQLLHNLHNYTDGFNVYASCCRDQSEQPAILSINSLQDFACVASSLWDQLSHNDTLTPAQSSEYLTTCKMLEDFLNLLLS